MSYLVLSRKYRPRTFEELVGQQHITETLKRAIDSDRVGQAYIFSGTRGTGKTTMARILAKALNCEKGPTSAPCLECDVCRSIDSGDDVDVIEIDGASHNSVDDVRELRANANYRPARARLKIYYIDEVHMLSSAAFNALLKTLEEPPAHVKFIFSTTEPHKIPLTIQSRCQRFDFRNISAAHILERLRFIAQSERIEIEDGALALLTRFAAGSMRDAESLLDQVASFSPGKVSRADVEAVLGVVPTEALSQLFNCLVEGDTAGALESIETVLSGGTAGRQFLSEFIDYLRDVLVARECGADSQLLVRSEAERAMLSADAPRWSEEAYVYAMQLLSETYARLARFPLSRGLLDVAVVKLSRVEDFVRLSGFLSDLRSGGEGVTVRREGTEPLPSHSDAPQTPRAPRQPAAASSLEAALAAEARKRWPLAANALERRARITLDGQSVKISLPANAKVELSRLQDSELHEALEKAASDFVGGPVRVKAACDLPANGEGDGERPGDKAALWRRAREAPAVRRVLEVFGGTISKVDKR